MAQKLKHILWVLVVLFAFTGIGIGDVGNFNDYDSGSSWSSSSSNSDSSSSWDRSSSSWDRSSFDSSSSSSSSGSSSSLPASTSIGIIILLLFIVLPALYQSLWKIGRPDLENYTHPQQHSPQGSPKMTFSGKWPNIPDHTLDVTNALQETDPAFNAAVFLTWVKEVFFQLQYAWMDRDWEKVRPFESEELYAIHERQLQEYKRLGRINIIERINVNNAYFFALIKDKEWETLSVVMHVRMIDYIVDEQTRRVLKGTPNEDCFMSYFYVFKRKAGMTTLSAKQGANTIACPNCGAPTHVVSSGKCEYCNFVITVKDHGWVLTDIVGIKPPYNYGTGGIVIKDTSEE